MSGSTLLQWCLLAVSAYCWRHGGYSVGTSVALGINIGFTLAATMVDAADAFFRRRRQ